MLNGMGLSADQISAIIEAHTETVEGLKASVKEAEKKAEGYDALVAEKGKLEKKYEALKEASGSDDWKAKYEKEKADFKAYKDEQANKKAMFFLIDEYIKRHAGQPVILDFNGSMNENVARLYKGFGGIPYNYSMLHFTRNFYLGGLIKLYKAIKH